MRATHARVVLALVLGSALGFIVPASPASASGKAKKAASSEPKSLDDMMGDSAKSKKADKPSKSDSSSDDDDKKADDKKEEEVAEPDAWEKPPEEEKAPPKKAAPVVEEEAAAPGAANRLEAGLLLGWGFETDKAFSVDPYGLGFGLRLGYEFDFKLFIGVGYEYFLGSSGKLTSGTFAATGASVNSSANYMFGHVEAGYDIWVSNIIIRPSVWLGLGFGTQDPHPQTNGRKTVTDFFFAPGVSVIDTFSGSFFFGGDLRLHKVTGDGASALALYATGGLRF